MRRSVMAERKEHVAASIVQVREHLEHALAALERLPALDPSTVACAAHALNNYLTLAGGTVELLLAVLATHPDELIVRFCRKYAKIKE